MDPNRSLSDVDADLNQTKEALSKLILESDELNSTAQELMAKGTAMQELSATSLASIAASLEAIVARFAICFCGHKETIHAPNCTDANCRCTAFITGDIAIARVLQQLNVQFAEFRKLVTRGMIQGGPDLTH